MGSGRLGFKNAPSSDSRIAPSKDGIRPLKWYDPAPSWNPVNDVFLAASLSSFSSSLLRRSSAVSGSITSSRCLPRARSSRAS